RVAGAVCLGLFSVCAAPLPNDHDSHALSAEEMKFFVPLVCRDASKLDKADFECGDVIDYPGQAHSNAKGKDVVSGSMSLDAVIYGGFTKVGADEAFLTYSGLEPHVFDYGGGVLFRREQGKWRRVKWFPGDRMEICLGIPGDGPQRVL